MSPYTSKGELKVAERIKTANQITEWVHCNPQGPYQQKRKAQRDTMLLTLKTEEGATSQGMQVASRS